jgi:glutaredoxin
MKRKKELKIYTSEECIYCDKLKKGLDKLKMEYINIDIDKPENEKEWEKIFAFSEEGTIPVITVQPHALVPKRSFNTIDEALELIKFLMK